MIQTSVHGALESVGGYSSARPSGYADRSAKGLKRPIGQSLIRALRHIIEFDSGLLIRHLDLRWASRHAGSRLRSSVTDTPRSVFFKLINYVRFSSSRYQRAESPMKSCACSERCATQFVFAKSARDQCRVSGKLLRLRSHGTRRGGRRMNFRGNV
jgi:hypothetical protein